jgi:hypothetical protein
MASIKILADTFAPTVVAPENLGKRSRLAEFINGTVDVQIGNQTVTAYAMRGDLGLHVFGFIGRYKSAGKAWNASVGLDKHGRLNVWFGRDDRASKFNKQNGISWEPETYFA